MIPSTSIPDGQFEELTRKEMSLLAQPLKLELLAEFKVKACAPAENINNTKKYFMRVNCYK